MRVQVVKRRASGAQLYMMLVAVAVTYFYGWGLGALASVVLSVLYSLKITYKFR
ncbi:hypothetical protein I5772_14065 [Klebsiella pneumoniae]|uniref:Uncharacterized protein n=1 Tax=Klebsiella pneumoniae TaxID=573 RepID=A0A7X2GPQ2_KLEPN|nr:MULTISPECIES: hypothetical protein [Klebsiella]QFG06730.1 hypothetical protein CPT_Mulock_028 [Klebsiella phage Mulock]HEC2112006.1 hypothetical protein [Klebsiella oxytoca]EKW2586190.1 hypothetical protein [Klebsiella pneumoniae]ELI8930647.1 hypothetical protein [Klebsiella pneumoniae]MBD0019757.1 hypothetical protein [Klebsiella pneumoniae]